MYLKAIMGNLYPANLYDFTADRPTGWTNRQADEREVILMCLPVYAGDTNMF